jgi:hypothetical protein
MWTLKQYRLDLELSVKILNKFRPQITTILARSVFALYQIDNFAVCTFSFYIQEATMFI